MKRVLTNRQVTDAYELYTGKNISTIEIAKILGCSPSTIQREFKVAGHTLKDNSHAKQKYSLNENVFDNIDSEEKAYWLGFLYADGNVSKTNRVRLSLAEQDREIVEAFSQFVFGEIHIKTYVRPPNKVGQNLLYVDVCNKHIASKLAELGCPPNKTLILTFPKWLDNKLTNHFVRGYFDGDGCLSNYKEKTKGRGKNNRGNIIGECNKSEFSILSTSEFLQSLHDIFSFINVNSTFSKRYKNRLNNNYTLKVKGNNQIIRLMEWIYENSTIFLQRKFDKYQELIALQSS